MKLVDHVGEQRTSAEVRSLMCFVECLGYCEHIHHPVDRSIHGAFVTLSQSPATPQICDVFICTPGIMLPTL